MAAEQRAKVRRASDRLLRETMRVHRTLLDLLHGRGSDLSETLSRIQRLGVDLGRRQEDRELGGALSDGLQSIARRLLDLGVIDQLPRRVRLTKVLGSAQGKFPVGILKVGWEMDLPKAGERYCLYLDDGRIFRTAEVVEHGQGHFRTGNSVYRLEIVESNGRPDGSRIQGTAASEVTPTQ